MSITSALVFYAVVWALTFYMVSPFWQRSQDEAGERVPGTPASAPVEPRIGLKALLTTLIASLAFAGLYYVIEWQVVTLDELAWIRPPSER